MGVPPLPPVGDVIEWIVALVIAGIAVVALGFLSKYLVESLRQPVTRGFEDGKTGLEDVMRELLKEMRMLRREIEELRKELRE